MTTRFLLLILAIAVASTWAGNKQKLTNAECKEKLQGTIIPLYAKSVRDTLELKVTFPSGSKVKCGNYLSEIGTLQKPTVKYYVNGSCDLTTVLFLGVPHNIYDTDVIIGTLEGSKTEGNPYRHWLVHNIPADVLKKGFNGKQGDTVTDFLIPLNPTSDHQYTFFVYCQQYRIPVNGKSDGLVFERTSFNVTEYARQHDLGTPLAINYFVSSLVDDQPIPPSLPLPSSRK